MSSIVKQKVGNKIYLYESVSYRNEQGKPRNKRVPIGKIDEVTGNPVYKSEFIARTNYSNEQMSQNQANVSFSITDLLSSSVKEFGAFYLFRTVAEQIGLLSALRQATERWQEIFLLATYIVSSGDPFLYCQDWLENVHGFASLNLSSQRISELLDEVTADAQEKFYHNWSMQRSELEYLALDITSVSSYSDLIDDVEWGYNRDMDNLAQINICLLVGSKSRLPFYQITYSGSLKDVSTLNSTIAKLNCLSEKERVLIVMDKGFYSVANIDDMIEDQSGIKFIMAVPFTTSFAKNQVESERKDIDTLKNTLIVGKDSIRGITKVRSWKKGHKLFAHVFYNAVKATRTREDLYAHITSLKAIAEVKPEESLKDPEHIKYLIIRQSVNKNAGYTVNVRDEVVERELKNAGWMVLISNDVDNAKEAITIYRDKDVVEKGFQRLKNCLDMKRLRVHKQSSMQGKVFVGFIALILLSHINRVMTDKQLYREMTAKKLIMTLAKLRIQNINGKEFLFPLTKQQKKIYKAFDVEMPVL